MRSIFIFPFYVLICTFCFSQTENLKLNAIELLQRRIDNKENKCVNMGISVGFKKITKSDLINFKDEVISSIDTTLKLQKLDNGFIVLSTELIISPFLNNSLIGNLIIESSKGNDKNKVIKKLALNIIQRLSFIASVNLAEVSMAQTDFTYNKTIDGGLGIGFRMSENFWLAWSFEVSSHRKLRDYVKAYENQKITINGITLTELDKTDNTLFYNKRLKANNIKLIMKF